MKIEKQGETKMTQCLEMALYQSHEGRERKNRFHGRFVSRSNVLANPAIFDSFSHSPHTYILDNKRKRKKKADYICIHQHCYLSLLCNNYALLCNNYAQMARELEPHYQMQFCVLPRTLIFFRAVLPPSAGDKVNIF